MNKDDVLKLEFISRSPAGFDCYYCKETDRCIKIKGDRAIIYSERGSSYPDGKLPHCFSFVKEDELK